MQKATTSAERLRTSETMDNDRIMLEYRADSLEFCVCTFISALFKSKNLAEAAVFFEVLEFVECDISKSFQDIARAIKKEIKRNPWNRLTGSRHGKIMLLVDGVEKRLTGLRPVVVGSKSSCVVWR